MQSRDRCREESTCKHVIGAAGTGPASASRGRTQPGTACTRLPAAPGLCGRARASSCMQSGEATNSGGGVAAAQAVAEASRKLQWWRAEPAALAGAGHEELGELVAHLEASLSRARAAQLQVRRRWRAVPWLVAAGVEWACQSMARCRGACVRRRRRSRRACAPCAGSSARAWSSSAVRATCVLLLPPCFALRPMARRSWVRAVVAVVCAAAQGTRRARRAATSSRRAPSAARPSGCASERGDEFELLRRRVTCAAAAV